MSNDIKISRELAERFAHGRFDWSHVAELRALLAAPVVERQDSERVTVERELLVIANVCVIRTHDLLVQQMKVTDHKDDYRAEIARLKSASEQLKCALISTSVVKPTPVAYVLHKNGAIDWDQDIVISNTGGDEPDERFEWRPVYAEQPAPVSVVLPDRLPDPTTAEIVDSDCNYSTGYAEGWNAGLDKVKELNQ